MTNGFPIIAGEQNFASQGTKLFAQAPQNGTFSDGPIAYVGVPLNQPLEAVENVHGIIGGGNGTGVGVFGWGGAFSPGLGIGPGPGVAGWGGVFLANNNIVQQGGDGVQGVGGPSGSSSYNVTVPSGNGLVGWGGLGTASYEVKNPDGFSEAITGFSGGSGVSGFGGDSATIGVPGDATNVQPTDAGIGVVGIGGYASSQNLYASGVVGWSFGDDSGFSPPTSNFFETQSGVAGWGAACGIYGFSGAGIGVAAESYGSNAIMGINLKSADPTATAIRGMGPRGGLGVVGEVPASTSTAVEGAAIYGYVNGYLNSTGLAGPLAGGFYGPVLVLGPVETGPLTVNGNFILQSGGTKSVAVKFPDRSHRLLYCMESPECWFEDFGEAKLTKGKAQIKLPRDFAAVIKTDSYHVFLTAYGRSNGLYVSKRTRQGFIVEEQGGGKSNVNFSFRIVGKRKDVKAERFAKVSLPKIGKPPKLPPLPKRTEGKQKRPLMPQKPIMPMPSTAASATPPQT
jgi:hypothetical protein